MLLASLLLLAPAAPAAAPAPSQAELRAAKEVDAWLRAFRRAGGEPQGPKLDELPEILRRLDAELGPEEDRRREVFAAALDLLGAGVEVAAARRGVPTPAAAEVIERMERWFGGRLGEEDERWIAREVLVMPTRHDAPRRLAGVHVLSVRRDAAYLLPLLFCARTAEDPVRGRAVEALAGWNEESVHSFFIEALSRPLERGAGLDRRVLESHFQASGPCPPGRTAQRIQGYLRAGLDAEGWRGAVGALAVAPALADPLAVPLLIDGLERWRARGEAGEQAKRVQHMIAAELERRSGRAIGPHPGRWRTWWNAVLAGDVPPPSPQDGPPSKAGFFGLRPTTDRVTFVIDRSGSMESPFNGAGAEGRTSHARYDEAIDQMLSYLTAAGPETRFDVVLFANDGRRWRSRLVAASPENLLAARRWLAAQRPDGGTQLRRGIELAMRLSPNGRVDVDRLEADTVIVLCDGATDEGPAWVVPFLERTQGESRMVFHGVRIGNGGDGTLELLAGSTGGEFVLVQG